MNLPINYYEANWLTRKLVREKYIQLQNGKCYFCKVSLKDKPHKKVLEKPINIKLFPNGFFKHPIHLHHNHETGLTIGAVHSYCNAVLWQYFNE